MKPIKPGVILLAFLLAAMAMVPMVTAADNQKPALDAATIIGSNDVSSGTALQSAVGAMNDFISRNALDENWNGAAINPEPEIIYDANGRQLFYLFTVEKNGKRIGEIKAAANKVVGGSIVTIGTGAEPVDMAAIEMQAATIIGRDYKDATIDSISLVCYNYPQIGASVAFTTPDSGKQTIVIDAYDYSVVPESDQVSFYNGITSSDVAGRIDRYNADQDYFKAENYAIASPMATVTKTISGFSLYPQQGANWCAFATAQMISAYYGYSRTQSGIASTMGVNPDDGASIELTRSNYYVVPTASGGLGKTGTAISYINMFTYTDLVNEIAVNRPIHTDRYESLSYHARAITGYSYTTTAPVSQYLYIYDPWPTTSGAVYWENWNVFSGAPNPVHAILYVRN
ncbi:C39 family peptidase [Methanoregula sp.]|uniref:C39 family peptidase n=1 Tax=Methanoregula sp. TaxID=2052170 RepID=UPI00237416CB|nr:C39 family peptidase [Methanoregula sp.]MDD1685651.1 C39 family peptidase [Methanoregula sp.]